MPTNALVEISPPRDCTQTEQLARKWAVTFAELFCVSLEDRGPRFVGLWVSALTDLKPEALESACQRAMQACKFFPTPAEIRSHVDRIEDNTAAIDDELAWQRVLEHCRVHVWRDGGRTGPRLSDAIEFAVRRAGGWFYLAECPERELIFARQRFLDGLENFRNGVEQFTFLPEGPAKGMIAAAAVRKALPGTHQAAALQTSGASDDRITPDYFDEARQRLGNVLRPREADKPERKRLAVIPHVAPPETFAGTPEGKLFREWGRAYHAGETALCWRDYRAAKNPAEAVAVSR